jgi:outer membrane protein assembly factor BamA
MLRCSAPLLLAAASLALGCAETIPKRAYGVDSLAIEGAEQMDDESIKLCLATQERPSLGFTFGGAEDPRCGVPPFDAPRLPVSLWSWPWTDWPLYDKNVFARDQSRIERWYQARGFYDARVTKVELDKDDDDRLIDVTVFVREGEPVLVSKVDVTGLDALSPEVADRIRSRVKLAVDGRFDEVLYEASKRALLAAVREASYARAKVTGRVSIDPATRRAHATFEVELGEPCRFGDVQVSGHGVLPARAIWAAADLERDEPFSESALLDAKLAIFALGPFASVELVERPRKDAPVIDVLIKVVPGRTFRFGVGAGMQVGTDPALTGTDGTGDSFAQWDVHLLAKVEHRNFLGGMRRLTIEDRPRLIFDEPFPGAPSPRLGNLLVVEFRQPAFVEPRTTLIATTRWDRGPDPFGGDFSRSDVVAGIGPERRFLGGKLTLASTLNLNLFVPDNQRPYPDYSVTYLQHAATLDLRNDSRAPRRGGLATLTLQHAGYFLPSDWDYVRITPEARGYVPLPLGIVLATRLRIGLMEITESDIVASAEGDPYGYLQRLRELGPLRQRLRGGGHNSVRGYAPNTLGDITSIGGRLDSGGLRQWETSVELRVPITASFGTVLFVDAGDVSRDKAFRLDAPQTTFGIGLRYKTLVGPLRLDAGFSPPSMQTIGGDPRTREHIDPATGATRDYAESTVFGAGGALHFTIGEAF